MRTMTHVKLKQIIAQGEARRLVDGQHFAQRRAEKAQAALDGLECEANANSVMHAYEHMNGAIKR